MHAVYMRYIGILCVGVLDEVGGQSMQIENLLAADASNQRIIEQLNGQVYKHMYECMNGGMSMV